MPYAYSVTQDLNRRGVRAHYIEFFWRDGAARSGYHACCIFYASSRWWVVDNESPLPEACAPAQSVLELLQHWYPQTVFVRIGVDIKL